MLLGNHLPVFSNDGLVTVVHRAYASTADRSRALSTHDASRVISRLFMGGDRDVNRHKLCDLHRVAAGDRGLAYSRANTSHLADQVLRALSNGTILVLDGWMMGSSWTPRRFATRGDMPLVDEDGESPLEVRMARRAMGGRQEEVAFEGARYVLLPASRWRDLKVQGGYEAVRQEEAAAVLQRMSIRAASADQKAALGEAAKVLADTTRTFIREGLFLVRRSTRASVAPTNDAILVATPSQIVKQVERVEKVDPVMDGEMVELDLSEVELPVESDAAEGEEASEDDASSGRAEASEGGDESETPEPSDDSSARGAE